LFYIYNVLLFILRVNKDIVEVADVYLVQEKLQYIIVDLLASYKGVG
jgi:hypothetical protein